jgi:DNA-binding CsgD family transcriptional regulator
VTVATNPDPPFDVAAARRVLAGVRALQLAAVEQQERERVEALDRVRKAVRRLGELGSHEGVLGHAAAELGGAARFDRVLLSAVRDGVLEPHALWQPADGPGDDAVLERLRRAPVPLAYPLVEAEVVLAGGSAIVDVRTSGPRSPRVLAEALRWTSYVVVAVTLAGRTVGLLHATPGGRRADRLDEELAALYTDGLADALGRAALRQALRRHRQELRAAVRMLTGALDGDGADPPADASGGGDAEASQLAALTPRELEVLRLLARGRTNAAIAKALIVSDDTVKYHVKNILRKLQASSRADAVARYLRGTDDGP